MTWEVAQLRIFRHPLNLLSNGQKKNQLCKLWHLSLNSICLGSVQKLRKTPKYFGAAQIYRHFQTGLCNYYCVPLSLCPHYCHWQFCVLCIHITYYFSIGPYFAFSVVLLFSVTLLFENHVSLWQDLIICASLTPHSKFSGRVWAGAISFPALGETILHSKKHFLPTYIFVNSCLLPI